MTKRIQWTIEEIALLASKALEELGEVEFRPVDIDRLQKKYLPEDRQKKSITTKASISEIQMLSEDQDTLNEILGVKPIEEVIEKPSITEEVLESAVLKVIEKPEVQTALDAHIKKIVDDMIAKQIQLAFAHQMKEQSKEEEKEYLPKILIAGLIPIQMEEIKKEFGDVFNLRFWQQDSSYKQLRNSSKGVDKIIVNNSFVSHQVTNIANASGVDVIQFSGGVSGLKEMMMNLYVNEFSH